MRDFPNKSGKKRTSVNGRAVLVLLALALAAGVFAPLHGARAAVLYFTGFETGDASEINTLSTGASVQNSTVAHGAYALKQAYNSSTLFASSPSTNTFGLSVYLKYSGIGTTIVTFINGGSTQFYLSADVGTNKLVVTQIASLGLSTTTGSTQLSAGNWYLIRVAYDAAAGGVVKVWLNDNLEIDATHSSAGAAINTINLSGPGAPNEYFFDDIVLNDSASLPGKDQVITRQFVSTAPTYDAFTKSTGSTIDTVWNETPYNATNNADSGSSGAAQTAFVSSFSDTQAGHGAETIGANDTVAGAKVGLIAKTSSTAASGGAASIRRRIGSTDTDTSITMTTGNAYYEAPIFLDTLANLNSSQAGFVHGANTKTQTVEDAWVMVAYTPGSAPAPTPSAGIQVSSRSDTLSDSRPSATSNQTIAFTTNTQITGSSTITLTFSGSFTIPGSLNCGDVDAATSSQFNFNYPGCVATATAWGFSVAGQVMTLTAPTDTAVHVVTGTPITINIGTNATYQQQGVNRITSPSTPGTYTISVGGTFGGAGNILVSVNSGQTVQATVAENLSFTVSSVQAANCTADDGATVTKIDSVGGSQASSTIFSYTGAVQSWTVPVGVNSITINAGGAGSGDTPGFYSAGGTSSGTLAVTPGTTFYVNVGGSNGYNGGGSGCTPGGGMTWFSPVSTFATPTVLLVAGGGGGGGYDVDASGACDDFGGNGGGTSGANGNTRPGYGGTQTAGGAGGSVGGQNGSAGQGGYGGSPGGGGGGGGFYGGGGGGGSSSYAGGGGGGSGYVTSTLINAVTTQGTGSTGNGSLTLTYTVTPAPAIPFGAINSNTFYQGCQDLIVSTNALGGYSLTVQEKYAMQTANGLYTIPDTTCDAGDCSVVTATTWVTPTKYGLGHTCWNVSGSDCGSTFSNGTKFRPLGNIAAGTATTVPIMANTGPVASSVGRAKYRLSVSPSQAPGAYATVIMYTLTPTY